MDFHKYKWIVDDAINFTTKNPTLLNEQIGFEKDTHRFKMGDGVTEWKDLRYLDSDQNNTADAVLEEDVEVMGVTVGNLTDNMVLSKGTTLTQLMKTMLQKRILPTYMSPTMNITLSPSSVQEKDKEITVQVTASFNKNDAGNITKYELYKNGTLIHDDISLSTYEETYTISYNTVFMAKIYYSDGAIKQDNFGEDYETGRILSGSISSSKTLTSVYPFYFGIRDDIENYNIIGLTKNVSVKGNKSFKYTGIDVYCTIAYDASYSDLVSIIDANGFECLNGFTKKIININGTDYKLYYTLEKATVSDFQYTFKF